MPNPPPTDGLPSTPRTFQLALAALFTLGALTVLALQALQFNSGPTRDDWRLAAEHVRAHIHDGDGFLVLPAWESQPRTFLQEFDYMPAEQPTWFDTAPYGRLWVLIEVGREDDAHATLAPHFTLKHQGTFGRAALLLATRQPDNTLWDALEALEHATVTREPAGQPAQPCQPFTPGAWPTWRCPGGGSVGLTLQVVTNDEHRCIWAAPLDPDGRLRVAFTQIPLGAHLEVFAGQPIDAVRSDRGGPVTFEVHVDGQLKHTHTFGIHDEGFLPWTLPLSARGKGDVEFVISAPDPTDRFFCFAARTLR